MAPYLGLMIRSGSDSPWLAWRNSRIARPIERDNSGNRLGPNNNKITATTISNSGTPTSITSPGLPALYFALTGTRMIAGNFHPVEFPFEIGNKT